jgi:hypothetical protein
MTQLTQTQVVHVRFEGRSEELTLDTLNLTAQSTDTQIKRAVAHYFERSPDYFNSFVVVRNSQAIIVRPEAIYG